MKTTSLHSVEKRDDCALLPQRTPPSPTVSTAVLPVTPSKPRLRAVIFWLTTLGLVGALPAAEPAAVPSATPAGEPLVAPGPVVILNPFVVTREKDVGYKATNVTSGTRLDTAIKDVPFALEVITAEFIHDTGATSLREALKYSAGIQLQSQNDYTGNGFSQYQNPGGVNNPEMQTANKTNTAVVIRGFTTDNALRDGFRRKVTTDAANIERIEVVRGPAALLYGIGNFGGVVNYLPKTPGQKRASSADFTLGTFGLLRATLDTTAPFAAGRGGYRLTVAAQQNGDYTDHYRVRKIALAAAGGPGSGFITLTASKPEGAAYLDAVHGYTRDAGQKHVGSDNWPGWFFNSAPTGTGYNSAAQDTNSFANSPSLSAPETDRNTGWDGQIIVTPTEDWQILFSFSKNNHEILSLGQFPDYPGQQADRWAPWMFPNGQWGLSGFYGKNVQYTDETRTSTFSFQGLIYPGAQGMDYPKWTWSLFTNLRLTKRGWKGTRLGGGGVRTGPQEYASGFTHAGDALKDNSGLPLILSTSARWTVNVFAHHEFKVGRSPVTLQLNIDNLLDDQKQYGLLWAPGRSTRLTLGTTF